MPNRPSSPAVGTNDSQQYQQGAARGISRNALSDRKQFSKASLAADARDSRDSDVEIGVANDSGTKPGRKVDHANPLDIPPHGMKRNY